MAIEFIFILWRGPYATHERIGIYPSLKAAQAAHDRPHQGEWEKADAEWQTCVASISERTPPCGFAIQRVSAR